jgi:hypothetical protein
VARGLQRDQPHADEVGAVDALVGDDDDGLDPLEVRPLGGPSRVRVRVRVR